MNKRQLKAYKRLASGSVFVFYDDYWKENPNLVQEVLTALELNGYDIVYLLSRKMVNHRYYALWNSHNNPATS